MSPLAQLCVQRMLDANGTGRTAVLQQVLSHEPDGERLYREILRDGAPSSASAPPAGVAADDADDGKQRPSQATRLVSLAAGAEFFHTPDGDAFASVPIAQHRETWALRSKGFRRWLAYRYYSATEKTPGAQAVEDALRTLEARAQFDGPECQVATRIAELDGAIFLDLANADWQAVRITSTGWEVVSDPPVRFRRTRGMLPLPAPTSGGTLEDLRQFVNLDGDDHAWRLLVGWLVAAARPRGPYPVLVLHGEQGSAKSTTGRLLRALIDPNSAPLRSEPRDDRDIMIAATNGHIIGLDNLSRLSAQLSDALCRLATGGGFATRELYSDSEEVLFDATRPVMLNGIEELATRGDLLDRSIVLYLPAIPEDRRRPEAELWQSFEATRPRLLGALLDGVVSALAHLPETRLASLPRMADVALWVTAAERGLRWPRHSFVESYRLNRQAANDLVLDGSTVAGALRDLIADGPSWSGTATALLKALDGKIDDHVRRLSDWPKTPRALSNTLHRLAPTLRAAQLDVSFDRVGRNRARTITIRTDGESCVRTVPSVRDEIQTADETDMARTHPTDGTDPIVRSAQVHTDDADDADADTQPLSYDSNEDAEPLPW